MSWAHDVCLSCDNQTQEGQKFCSQACRLADMERAGYSEPPTPAAMTSTTHTWDSWNMSSRTSTSDSRQFPFQISSAVNFSADRRQPIESPPSSPRSRSTYQSSSYFSQHTATSATTSQATGRGLTLSPSRSSLSSVSSTGTNMSSSGLSEQTLNQLRDYSGAFDQTRSWKRRTTYG